MENNVTYYKIDNKNLNNKSPLSEFIYKHFDSDFYKKEYRNNIDVKMEKYPILRII